MKIINLESGRLASYCVSQINNLFLMDTKDDLKIIEAHLEEALKRTNNCIADVRMWTPGQFDILHSSQYCIFLYYLANTIWKNEASRTVCTKLFLLNKALNGIDCFYEIELPEVFFIGHSVGIVLAKATYGNHLVLYQNVTVGKNHGVAPVLENEVILYPHSAVIGNCLIHSGSVISQGVSVIDKNTPSDSTVFQGDHGKLVFKKPKHRIASDFFRSLI